MAIFCLGLIGLLFFSLRPARENSGRTRGLPCKFAAWINAHDNASNFLAYGGMGAIGILLAKLPTKSSDKIDPANARAKEVKVMTGFAVLVSLIEFSQKWIPGRVADVRDVLTAWTGLLAGWGLILVLFYAFRTTIFLKPRSL